MFIDEKKLMEKVNTVFKDCSVLEMETIIKVMTERINAMKIKEKQRDLIDNTMNRTGLGTISKMFGGGK